MLPALARTPTLAPWRSRPRTAAIRGVCGGPDRAAATCRCLPLLTSFPSTPAPLAAANPGVNQDALAVPQRAYPAGYQLPNIISVAATTSSDILASFSNYGA